MSTIYADGTDHVYDYPHTVTRVDLDRLYAMAWSQKDLFDAISHAGDLLKNGRILTAYTDKSKPYWTSTTLGRKHENPSRTWTGNAIVVYPATGEVAARYKKLGAHVRCVRDLDD
jgi:hypothetical protein